MMKGGGGQPPSKSSLNGQLTALAQRRISKEKQKLEQEREELESCGIYTSTGDELHKALAMVVGPEGTPYEFGFYFFEIAVPNEYPLQPPHVDFRTGDGRVRFNPNLYVEGKVCLSILGTWSGPSWTGSCTLRTVLMSIQSLLNEHPIQNEPGHEKEQGKNDKAYNEIIRYENIAVAIVGMLKRTPAKFQCFRPHMRQIFLKRVEQMERTLQEYKAKEGTKAMSPIWNFPVMYKVKALLQELKELGSSLELEEKEAGSEPGASASCSSEPPAKRARLDTSPENSTK